MSIKNPDELLRNFRTVNIGKPEIFSEDLILNLISFLSYTCIFSGDVQSSSENTLWIILNGETGLFEET